MSKIVCLCGSVRFSQAFIDADIRESLAGNIVLSITGHGFWKENEVDEKMKSKLDKLHYKKILLSDEILVLNVNGYIGESVKNEIKVAKAYGKKIRYLVEPETF